MTYNEWRDELKSNLLSVSDSERRRVLDYYAEAYADRRDAGFTEREIIEDFGAPYDAAQRILSDGYDEGETRRNDYRDEDYRQHDYRDSYSARERRETERARRDEERRLREEERERRREDERMKREREREEERRRREAEKSEYPYYHPYEPQPAPAETRGDYTWLFVLLCFIFFWPIFGAIVAMSVTTIVLVAAPFGTLIGGFCEIGAGIGAMVGGNLLSGLANAGIGIILCGAAVILFPACLKLVKLMWTLFKRLFVWLKAQFSGRRSV